jgi:Pyrroline-5-carboxylate reductase
MNIGFIGCGQMGKMLLDNIIKAGDTHSILITTKTKSSAEASYNKNLPNDK